MTSALEGLCCCHGGPGSEGCHWPFLRYLPAATLVHRSRQAAPSPPTTSTTPRPASLPGAPATPAGTGRRNVRASCTSSPTTPVSVSAARCGAALHGTRGGHGPQGSSSLCHQQRGSEEPGASIWGMQREAGKGTLPPALTTLLHLSHTKKTPFRRLATGPT